MGNFQYNEALANVGNQLASAMLANKKSEMEAQQKAEMHNNILKFLANLQTPQPIQNTYVQPEQTARPQTFSDNQYANTRIPVPNMFDERGNQLKMYPNMSNVTGMNALDMRATIPPRPTLGSPFVNNQSANQGMVDMQGQQKNEAMSNILAGGGGQELATIMQLQKLSKPDRQFNYDANRGGYASIDENTGQAGFITPSGIPSLTPKKYEINSWRDAYSASQTEQDPVLRQLYAKMSEDLFNKELELTGGKAAIQTAEIGKRLPLQAHWDEVRSKNRESLKSISPFAMNSIITRFDADPNVRKYKTSADSADTIIDLINDNSPVAAASIPTFMARASGEVGNLSEADKAPFGGSRALLERMQQVLQTAETGQLTEDNKMFVRNLANIMKNAALRNLDREAKHRAKQYSAGNKAYKEDELYYMLNPTGEYTPDAQQPQPKQGGNTRTIISKKYSPSRNQTKIIYSDGTEEIVDGKAGN